MCRVFAGGAVAGTALKRSVGAAVGFGAHDRDSRYGGFSQLREGVDAAARSTKIVWRYTSARSGDPKDRAALLQRLQRANSRAGPFGVTGGRLGDVAVFAST